MAVTNDQINGYYDNFLTKGKTTLIELFNAGNMSGEEQANVISTLLDSAMRNSLSAIELGSKLELLDKQVVDIESSIKVREEQSTQDLLNKQAQKILLDKQQLTETKKATLVEADTELKKHQRYSVIAQRKRQQGVGVDDDGNITYDSDGFSLVEKQIAKVQADKEFVDTQKTEMEKQVKHNAIIKGMSSMSDYVMGIGNAGLQPSQAMHTNFFSGHKILFLEAGASIDSSGNVTYKIGDTTHTIAKFDTGATATQAPTDT
jgi:hypothetical protein